MSSLSRYYAWLCSALGLGLALFALYVSGPFELINEGLLRCVVVFCGGTIVIISNPLVKKYKPESRLVRYFLVAIDAALLVAFVISIYSFLDIQEALWSGIFILQTTELLAALAGSIVLIELTRRMFGSVMAAVCVIALGYAFLGRNMPGFLAHPGLSFEEVFLSVWYSFDGVFGFPIGVVASIVMVFIVFGALLEGTGAASALLKLATVSTGRIRGGPGHSAIIASALFGTVSGNPVANVVGTGVFTIPMIKKQGFRSEFAGAVEAAASTGGQFTPPIMGAAAFIMADLLNFPYLTIALAALFPAAIYYFSLFSSVYAEASRAGIGATPEAERQPMSSSDWLNCLRFAIPLAIIILVMVGGRSPAAAGFWGVVSAIGIALLFEPALVRNPLPILSSMIKGGLQSAQLIVAVAAIGIIISVINNTGVGLSFAEQLSSVAETSIFMALVVAAVGALILGMGLPTLPAYLFVVLMIGPAITKIGIDPLQTHMFVLYFAVMSNVTPPFALASFAAAPIAEANPLRTAFVSTRVSLAGYLIPFLIIFSPSILIVLDSYDPVEMISGFVRAIVAIWLLATALAGHDAMRISWQGRAVRILLALSCLITWPGVSLPATAAGVALIFVPQFFRQEPSNRLRNPGGQA